MQPLVPISAKELEQEMVRCHNLLRAVISRTGVAWVDVDDVLQIAKLRILQKAHLWDGRAQFSSWAARVAYCCGLDYKKREAKRTSFPLCEWKDADPAPTPYEHAVTTLSREKIMLAMGSLPVHCREIMIRYYLFKEDIDEIAASLDLNRITVRTKMWRSRKMLRERLEGLI